MRLLFWRALQLLLIFASLSGLTLYISLNPVRCLPDCMGTNLSGSTLNRANLSNANFVEATLSSAALEGVVFTGTNLSGATLARATLLHADLSQAMLVGVDLSGADLRGITLFGANLSGANLSRVNLTRVDLRGATSLHGLILANARLIEANLAGTDLSGVDLSGANLTSANLEGANLSGVNLSGAILSGANLREADLSGTWLNLVDLTGADLRGASLAGATLIGSTVASANLSQANLSGVTAIGANFDGADLRGANISGARFLESETTYLDTQMDPLIKGLSEGQLSKVIRNARLKGVRFDDTVIWSSDSKATLETLLGFSLALPVTATSTTIGGVDLGEVDPAQFKGPILIAGSATVEPVTRAIADKFSAAGYPSAITVERSDTGPGFARLCQQGDIDIANASRAISAEESAACAEIGRIPLGFRIGTDAVVVVVHPSNDFLTDATVEELQQIFTVDNWFDINPRWPREPIERFVPASGSGTRSFFQQTIGVSDEAMSAASNTTTALEVDALAEALSSHPFGIGFLNYATFQRHIDQLRAIKVAGAAANGQNVEAGHYILSRALYVYTDVKTLQKKPQVVAFITFYLQQATVTSQEIGVFPASKALLKESAEALTQALTPER